MPPPTLAQSPRSASHRNHGEEGAQPAGRVSLDVVRGASPYTTAGLGGQGPEQYSATPSKRGLRALTPDSASRQRPVSMSALTGPRSPPTLVVNSPQSPSKSLHLPSIPIGSATSPQGPLTPAVPTSRPPLAVSSQHVRTPSHSMTANLCQRTPQTTDVSDVQIRSKRILPDPPHGTIARNALAPPPINRAEKPKIPTKPGFAGSDFVGSILQPEMTRTGDRGSPFSTPRSSGGSPEADEVTPNSTARRISSYAPIEGSDEVNFPRPPIHYSVVDRRRGQNDTSSRRKLSVDARESGFTKGQPSLRDLPERRPGLPPRPDSSETSQRIVLAWQDADHQRMDSYSDQGQRGLPSGGRSSISGPTKPAWSTSEFLPPPKRSATSISQDGSKLDHRNVGAKGPSLQQPNKSAIEDTNGRVLKLENNLAASLEYPDASQTNRRPPFFRRELREIQTKYETKLFDIYGQHVCTTGYLTRAWNSLSGDPLMSLSHGDRIKITALAFKPGATTDEEGLRLWLGTSYGEIQEVDLLKQDILFKKPSAHAGREIIKIHRHENSMWSLDDEGKLHIWLPDEEGLPNLHDNPVSLRVPRGHTFSMVIRDCLWLATGKEIRVFRPSSNNEASFCVTQHPLIQANVGEVTSGAVISGQLDRVYFGHTDGKVTVYSTKDYTCLGVVNVSVYKINALAGAGSCLWAGYNTGMIYVYDTRSQPWKIKKDWHAHENPVANILVDRSSVWKLGRLQIASIGMDNAIRLWDGMLEEDWLGMKPCVLFDKGLDCVLILLQTMICKSTTRSTANFGRSRQLL